jgi:class 3 adenylate cyclase
MAGRVGYITVIRGEHTGERVEINGGELVIGRGSASSFRLARDSQVSRRHCMILVREGKFFLEDLGSSNGTFLDGEKVKGRVGFAPPAYIAVGRSWLAVMPAGSDDEEVQDLFDSSFSAAGSILVPATCVFHERTEAFLVIDIVRSTEILQKSEFELPKIISVLGQILNRMLGVEPEPFLKCTGDGFFACFSRPGAALRAAMKIGPRLRRHVQKAIQICIALHWGKSRLAASGDRTGKDVHCVFDLQVLRHRAKGNPVFAGGVPELILMTGTFWQQLQSYGELKADNVGEFQLKGLEEAEAVYILRR